MQRSDFQRYFFSEERQSSYGGMGASFLGGFMRGGGGSDRDKVSEIIPDLVYLSNMPRRLPFGNRHIDDSDEKKALVVSCADISELADSSLLEEPGSKAIQYHVVAMRDVTAEVGSLQQIYDALVLMSKFADEKKQIHIHCVSGVGRSAMMTALLIAYRYLQKDENIVKLIDASIQSPLDPDSEDYLAKLYDAASKFVLRKRSCCQFYDPRRNKLALSVLGYIRECMQHDKPVTAEQDDGYRFMAALVQSAAFKKLQCYYYKQCYGHEQDVLKSAMTALQKNEDGWYAGLEKLSNTTDAVVSDQLKKLFADLLMVINSIAGLYPDNGFRQLQLVNEERNVVRP